MESNRQLNQNLWERRIQEAAVHDGGLASYCREHSLSISSLNYWRKKLSWSPQSRAKALTPFVAVTVEPKREELPDPKWLASFAATLIRGLR